MHILLNGKKMTLTYIYNENEIIHTMSTSLRNGGIFRYVFYIFIVFLIACLVFAIYFYRKYKKAAAMYN